jgi:hypothetical protein
MTSTEQPNQPVRPRRGLLTLEYIIGDQTYWLTSGFDRNRIGFTQLARNLFDCELVAGQLADEGSEIEGLEPLEGYPAYVFRIKGSGTESVGLATNVDQAQFLTWNELAVKLLSEGVSPSKVPSLWYQGFMRGGIVKPRPDCPIQVNKDVNYVVTAFLPPPGPEGVFAIMGDDYKPDTNPNWVTIKRDTEADYIELLKGFDIVAFKWGNDYLCV